MRKSLFRRALGAVFVLALVLTAVPAALAAENTGFTLIELTATDVVLDGTSFEYTGSEIKPNVTVTAGGKVLTLNQDYTLKYADNVEVGTGRVIVTGIGTASETVGYTGTVEHPFFIREKAPEFTTLEIRDKDVAIEAQSFPYTGSEIKPGITVTVDGKTLTEGRDYSLTYVNNIEVGTGTAIISGIATASETLGYTGQVKVNFSIVHTADSYPLTQITRDHVSLEGTEFAYTGKAIEPKVTVRVGDKTLTAGKDYSVEYSSNIAVGTAAVTVKGIATATENGGYTGEVTLNFTITHTSDTYPLTQIKDTDVTMEGTRFPYTGKAVEPRITVKVGGKTLTAGKDYSLTFQNNVEPGTATAIIRGIATATGTGGYTGEVTLSFTISAPAYKITKGSGATWYQGTKKDLSFTANGSKADFTKLTVDGKTVAAKHYTVKEGSTVVTLKASFLEKLDLGKHTIAIHFQDGEAEGTFSVSDKLDPTNPTTADTSHIGIWMGLLVLSLTSGALLLTKRPWKV